MSQTNPSSVSLTVGSGSSIITWTGGSRPGSAVTVVLMESVNGITPFYQVASDGGKTIASGASGSTIAYTAVGGYSYQAVVNNPLAGGTSTGGPTVSNIVIYTVPNALPVFTILSLTNTKMKISWIGGQNVANISAYILQADNSAMTSAHNYFGPNSAAAGNLGARTLTTSIIEGYYYSVAATITFVDTTTAAATIPTGLLLPEVLIYATGGTITTKTVGGIKYRTHAFTCALTEDFADVNLSDYEVLTTSNWNGWLWTEGGIAKNGGSVTGPTGGAPSYYAWLNANGSPYISTLTSPTVSIPAGRTLTITFIYAYQLSVGVPSRLALSYAGTQIYTTTTFSATNWITVTVTFTTTTDTGQFVFASGDGTYAGNQVSLISSIQLSEKFTVVTPAGLAVNSLVVAGGGGGGGLYYCGGGGGGGAVFTANQTVLAGAYPVVPGSGGMYGIYPKNGGNGGNSTFNGLTGTGGGGGAGNGNGQNGGCGGGGEAFIQVAGVGSQGFQGFGGAVGPYSGGGGGGMGGAGGNGAGGAAKAYTLGGTVYTVSGGGGGGSDSLDNSGGVGGGYGQCTTLDREAGPGAANTGGGGGGGGNAGGKGGSGIVLLSYIVSPTSTGGTITYKNVNGVVYKTHTFTSTGTFTLGGAVETPDILVVGGGGGGGGYIGGGGGGGVVTQANAFVGGGTYTVTVGNGGIGGIGVSANSTGGQASTFPATYETITGAGGGAGGGPGESGGSSGSFSGGSYYTPTNSAAGGAGANQNGFSATANTGGNGGNGKTATVGGVTYILGGGGGGGIYGGGVTGTGGAGGGGIGAPTYNPGIRFDGTTNTGGGGGGGSQGGSSLGGNGGSGLVVITFPVFFGLNPDMTPFKPRSPVGRSDYYKHTGRGMPRFMTEWMDSLIV